MKNLSKSAKILSVLLNLLYWGLLLGGLFYAFATAYGFFNLVRDPDAVLPTINGITLDYLEFYSSSGIKVDRQAFLTVTLLSLAVYLIQVPLMCYGIQLLRKVLRPIIDQRPFSGTTTILKRMGFISLLIAVVCNLTDWMLVYYIDHGYNLSQLFQGSSITRFTFHYQLDSTFLIVALVVFVLSGVFRYGEELQQLSDETL